MATMLSRKISSMMTRYAIIYRITKKNRNECIRIHIALEFSSCWKRWVEPCWFYHFISRFDEGWNGGGIAVQRLFSSTGSCCGWLACCLDFSESSIAEFQSESITLMKCEAFRMISLVRPQMPAEQRGRNATPWRSAVLCYRYSSNRLAFSRRSEIRLT